MASHGQESLYWREWTSLESHCKCSACFLSLFLCVSVAFIRHTVSAPSYFLQFLIFSLLFLCFIFPYTKADLCWLSATAPTLCSFNLSFLNSLFICSTFLACRSSSVSLLCVSSVFLKCLSLFLWNHACADIKQHRSSLCWIERANKILFLGRFSLWVKKRICTLIKITIHRS